VVDYRGLNKVTIKNRYPLPLIGELLDRLKTAKLFTTIDLRGAYNLVRMAEGEEWKTAFRTRYGHYEYQVMPFGLTNAPASFQHFINDIFSDILDTYVVAYLDDILIFSNNLDDHIKHVREVLSRLRDNSLFGKLEKCNFHKSSTIFLGYIISSNGIKMDPEKVEATLTWPTPKCVKDIQSFIGFANFYCRFIKDFAKVVAPLTRLTKKDTAWLWNTTTQNAFDTLKTAFTSAPILKYFNPELPIIVETDASDFAIGAVLSQKDNTGILHPIAYFSRKFIPAELNYEIYDKELLGIVEAFRVWRAYLEGAQYQITVITDHKNLEYFTTTKVLNRRQARWAETLGNYNFIIKYIPGTLNGKPDALSRRSDYHPKEGGDTIEGQVLIKPNQLVVATTYNEKINSDFNSQIINAYKDDPFTNKLVNHFKNQKAERTNELKQLIENYEYKNDFILFKGLIYIPDIIDIKLKLLHDYHDSLIAGHYGQAKTYELISRNYFWPKMRSFIKEYIETCDQCKRCKNIRHKTFGYLQSLPIAQGPWKSISMDFIVSLPNSNNFTAIFVVVDRFTKMAHFIPTTNEVNATTTAELFFNHIYKYHGLPLDIVSDRGTVFTSKFWSNLMKLINVKTNLSTSFHPQTDGQTERINQILETYIRLYCDYMQNNWNKLLTYAEFSYNNIQHSTTKVSPFFANYGFHPISIPNQLSTTTCETPAVSEFLSSMMEILKDLTKNILTANKTYEKYYNKKHLPDPDFLPGSKVWLNGKFIKTTRPNQKLDYTKLGPYEIIRKVGHGAYELKLTDDLRIHPVINVSRLEPAKENKILGRIQGPPLPIQIDQHEEYEVERILDSRIKYNKLEYFIDWKGYGINERTWQSKDDLKNAPNLIAEFHKNNPNKPKTHRVHPQKGELLSGTVNLM